MKTLRGLLSRVYNVYGVFWWLHKANIQWVSLEDQGFSEQELKYLRYCFLGQCKHSCPASNPNDKSLNLWSWFEGLGCRTLGVGVWVLGFRASWMFWVLILVDTLVGLTACACVYIYNLIHVFWELQKASASLLRVLVSTTLISLINI